MLSRDRKLTSQIIDLRSVLAKPYCQLIHLVYQERSSRLLNAQSSGDNKPINTFTFLFSSIRRRMHEFRVCAGLGGTEVLKREIRRRFCRSLGSWHRPSTLASNRLTPGKTPQRELSSGATLSASCVWKAIPHALSSGNPRKAQRAPQLHQFSFLRPDLPAQNPGMY